jgi:hypothetical protein
MIVYQLTLAQFLACPDGPTGDTTMSFEELYDGIDGARVLRLSSAKTPTTRLHSRWGIGVSKIFCCLSDKRTVGGLLAGISTQT